MLVVIAEVGYVRGQVLSNRTQEQGLLLEEDYLYI